VHANGKKWIAKLRYDGKQHNLDSFNTKEEAAAAYDKAARQHKGSDAVCSFGSAQEGGAAASLAASEWEQENPAAAPTSPPPPPPPATAARGMPPRRVAIGSIAAPGGSSSIYISANANSIDISAPTELQRHVTIKCEIKEEERAEIAVNVTQPTVYENAALIHIKEERQLPTSGNSSGKKRQRTERGLLSPQKATKIEMLGD
jgi:hypothetical protein